MEQIKRQTAFKVWISSILSGNFIKSEKQFEASYMTIKDKKVSRVNLIGSIIDKNQGDNFLSFMLDDSSGSISLKAWSEDANFFSNINIGDLVLVVGKIKEYNNQLYITPEIIRKLENPLWLRVRKLELTKLYGEPKRIETPIIEENKLEESIEIIEEKVTNEISPNKRTKVMSIIEGLDKGEGVPLSEVVIGSGLEEKEVNYLVENLIKEGEIFEIQKNRLRVVN